MHDRLGIPFKVGQYLAIYSVHWSSVKIMQCVDINLPHKSIHCREYGDDKSFPTIFNFFYNIIILDNKHIALAKLKGLL